VEIAAAIAAFLAPHLKDLLAPVTESAGRRLDQAASRFATSIWDRLRGRFAERPAAQEAAEDVAAEPEDEDALAALRRQLRKLLEQDPELARELQAILAEAHAAGATTITVQAIGERSIAVNQATGSTLSTGDRTSPPGG
jgi:hypothetical protein